jgi:drug/metabolite transporter (DMT)-like permease
LKVKDAQGTPAIAEQQMTLTVDISAIGAGDIAFFKPLLILTGLGMWLLLAIIIASIVGLMVILRAPDVGTSQDKSTAFVLGIVLIILGVVGYFISNLAYDKWGEKQWFLWLAVTLAISGAVGLLFLMNQLVTMWKGYRPGIIAKGTETFR